MIMIWRRAILIFTLLFALPLLAEAKIYLVSVGISDYPGRNMDLNLPARDAQTITWLYSRNASMQYCQLLNENATKEKIIAAMGQVFTKAQTDDIVVFFYSGHGYENGFRVYDDNLRYDEIRQVMALSKSKNKMIFADACLSGGLRTESRETTNSGNNIRNSNIMLFLSSRGNEYSYENSSLNNGYFTLYLQQGLRGGADTNGDRVITARELFQFVHKNVVNATGGEQHPVMWGNFSDNMPVLKW